MHDLPTEWTALCALVFLLVAFSAFVVAVIAASFVAAVLLARPRPRTA